MWRCAVLSGASSAHRRTWGLRAKNARRGLPAQCASRQRSTPSTSRTWRAYCFRGEHKSGLSSQRKAPAHWQPTRAHHCHLERVDLPATGRGHFIDPSLQCCGIYLVSIKATYLECISRDMLCTYVTDGHTCSLGVLAARNRGPDCRSRICTDLDWCSSVRRLFSLTPKLCNIDGAPCRGAYPCYRAPRQSCSTTGGDCAGA